MGVIIIYVHIHKKKESIYVLIPLTIIGLCPFFRFFKEFQESFLSERVP